MTLPDQAVRELTALAGVVLEHDNLEATLTSICQIAVRAIPGAEGSSLTAYSEEGPHAAASSSGWARSLDEMQYDEREGPCLDASRSGVVFRIRDTQAEPRWPNYMPRAAELGARSMVSLPLSSESKIIGALNIYSREPDAFDTVEVSVAEVIAAHASLATQVAATLFRHRDVAAQLQEAMASRSVIEQAKGILAASQRCSPDEAFTLLVSRSQHENRKLRDIAAELVERSSAQLS